MALFILKPIFWNTENYARPSGVRANSGYPSEHGYGHEEWNNSPVMAYSEGGIDYRAFHTEGIGNAPADAEAGNIFVFMYASHDGIQQLLGIAGGATCLAGEEHRSRRQHLVEKLAFERLSAEAWSVRRVRDLYAQDEQDFLNGWNLNLHWIPNWYCPADTYMWLDTPATLSPPAITGAGQLLRRFGRHTELNLDQAIEVMRTVPGAYRTPVWHRILADIQGEDRDSTAKDVDQILQRRDIPETTRRRLVDARLGQGRFRADVERRWDCSCAVSGCSVRAVIRASHIKPWSMCNNSERLDDANGLLLSANLDALFDRGMISFDDEGQMLVARRLSKADRVVLKLPRPLRKPLDRYQRGYMAYHRERFGLGTQQ